MLIKGNNGKAPARKRQSVTASSSSKSVRSNSVSKSRTVNNNSKAADKLDGNLICFESRAVESETGDRILEATGVDDGTSGNDLPSESVELTAITLHQPWASLIAAGKKQYETRSWGTDYRGLIAIHAGKTRNGCTKETLELLQIKSENDLPYGVIVAVAELTDCIEMSSWFMAKIAHSEKVLGDWKKGRYAWKLENIRAIEPIPATGKQGLWKWSSDSWNPDDFGEVQHKAEEDGQLNLLEWEGNEPPDPDDYVGSIEKFEAAYKAWVAAQTDQAEEELANFGEQELCDILMDGSTFAQESEPASPMPESNCGNDRPTTSVSGTVTAAEFLQQDFPESTELTTSESATLSSITPYSSSLLARLASPSALMGSDLQQTTQETASPMCSELSKQHDQNSQLLKTSQDSSTVPTPPATNLEPILAMSLIPYPRSGSMQNGKVSAALILPAPGVGKDSLLLRSPGGLSGGENKRPPGKSRLETQLNQLRLIQDGEVVAPEFLELGYQLPIGFTNPQENRTALELSQAQAQQLPIAHKSELHQETEITETDEKPLETPSTGALLLSDCAELNISLTLPPNIGALEKAELISMAQEQHQLICDIERKEFELAIEKLHRVRLTGVYLQEFKKRCQYGEFENQLEQAGISVRSAQNYMAIAKNWEIVEAKAKRVALLPEENENQLTFSLRWALEAVRDEKKQLKSAAPPKDPDGWKTPNTSDQPVVNLVKKALGGEIWLDPCSDEGGNIPAAVRYYKHDDGLAAHNSWSKTVFINPPFSDPFPWVERCCLEIARGSISAAVMLLKAGTVSNVGTGEWIKKYASAFCHWTGRIHFLNDQGNPVKGSDFDCVFIYFGARLDLFRGAFGGRGTIATIENHYSSVNKKHLLKNEIPEFGNTQAEQKQLAAAVGLGNGRSVLPDMRDADRERNERYDPHTVVDVLSSPMLPTIPTPAISENLLQPLGEPETFDETPLETRQFEKAKENCLNDYIVSISSNLSDFSDEQIAFLAKIINEESAKRIGF
ncbi:DNA N-6-adenine-methyltransferase [Microcoleus sp. herbarium5]